MGKYVSHSHSLLDDAQLVELIGKPDPMILEIGCNDGVDSEKFMQLFPAATLYCFDPEPRAAAAWKERMRAYAEAGRATLFETAIGQQIGQATFYQSSGTTAGAHKQDWDLSGSLNRPTGHLEYSPWCKFDNQIAVPVTRLDLFAYDHGLLGNAPPASVDLLWLDVQGGEAGAISGGRGTLGRTRFVYTEYGHWKKPLYEGQLNLDETLRALGPNWEVLAIYEGYNVLCRNKRLA